MKNYSLGPLEEQIMQYVRKYREQSVRDIHTRLKKNKAVAYTTVMTVMVRLAQKGLLSRKKYGKAYIYSPKSTPKRTVHKAIASVFARLVSQYGHEAIVAFSDEIKKASSQKKTS